MRITNATRTARTGSSQAKKAGGSSGFSIESSSQSRAPAQAASTGHATGIDAILALQSVEDPLLAKKKATRRGHLLLDALDALKADLLAGRVPEARIERLLTLIRDARNDVDPALDSIITDIELRARVELAKLGHY